MLSAFALVVLGPAVYPPMLELPWVNAPSPSVARDDPSPAGAPTRYDAYAATLGLPAVGDRTRRLRWLLEGLVRPDAGAFGGAPLLRGRTVPSADLVYGGVNYNDPTGTGAPLQWIRGREEQLLTPGFRLADFATRDGAPMVRIDPAFVGELERLRQRVGQLAVVSGYRHPAYNATVGGVGNSYHTAGRAADLWSPDHAPLDLARLALLTMGCEVGLGLGPTTVHVDVRGELATWTYEGASLSEPAFDAWALAQCGRPVPSWLAAQAAASWLSEPIAADSAGTLDLGGSAGSASDPVDPEALLRRHGTAVAEVLRRGGTSGAVALDLRSEDGPAVRPIAPSSPELAALGLRPLVAWCAARGDGAYVAYAVFLEDGDVRTGVTNVSGLSGLRPSPQAGAGTPPPPPPALSRPTQPSEAAPTAEPAPRGPAPDASPPLPADRTDRSRPSAAPAPASAEATRSSGSTSRGWAVVVASLPSAPTAAAEADAVRRRLGPSAEVRVVPVPHLGTYRVTVGPFPTSAAAQQALERLAGAVPEGAWITAL
ncbi:MAG: D-Ala-D-Ala carboxypeptidase family metallohydrolase [Rhodothermales bacterium]|nr:D-Ala-D-Ala carboxypeptidase family metallohydrolase [Rhodothermales bacterium]